MIELKDLSFRYTNGADGILSHIDLTIPDGQCVLLCGESGCGKTTLCRMINGLAPHFYEGTVDGEIRVDGLHPNREELYITARKVGSVFQNPRSQFFCVDTISELAFGCENQGLPEDVVSGRIAEVTRQLHIEPLLDRNIFDLSGGEKQKIACASVAAVYPDVFVLDEPTSNLDIDAVDDLKQTLLFWKSQGKTIIIAEHRLYWLADICDRVVYMRGGRVERDMPMEDFRALPAAEISSLGLRTLSLDSLSFSTSARSGSDSLVLKDFKYSYGENPAMDISELELPENAVIALIGHNGAGKSTLSRCLCGLERRFRGTVVLDGQKLGRRQLLKKSYMVMQDVNHQLFCETVDDEVRLSMVEDNADIVQQILEQMDLSEYTDRHPMSLSGGQKQRVAVASAILAEKELLIFDEPTSGLDYHHMEQTAQLISAQMGKKTCLIVTHDPELIALCCSFVIHMEAGTVSDAYALNAEGMRKLLAFFQRKSGRT